MSNKSESSLSFFLLHIPSSSSSSSSSFFSVFTKEISQWEKCSLSITLECIYSRKRTKERLWGRFFLSHVKKFSFFQLNQLVCWEVSRLLSEVAVEKFDIQCLNKSIRNIIYTLCYQNNNENDKKKKKKKTKKKEAHSHKFILRQTNARTQNVKNIVLLFLSTNIHT